MNVSCVFSSRALEGKLEHSRGYQYSMLLVATNLFLRFGAKVRKIKRRCLRLG